MRENHYNLPSLCPVTCHLQENQDVTELDKVFPKSLVINFGGWTMMGELSNRMARLAPLLIPCVNQSVYFQSQSAILSLFSTTTVSPARARVRERGTFRGATHLKISWFFEKRLPQNIVQTKKNSSSVLKTGPPFRETGSTIQNSSLLKNSVYPFRETKSPNKIKCRVAK